MDGSTYVDPMPLVGGEVRRVGTALGHASGELTAARTALQNLRTASVGTPSCDDATAAMLADLSTVVSRLVEVADDCVEVTHRHAGDDPDANTGPGAEAPS